MRLLAIDPSDPFVVAAAVPAALDGAGPLALGFDPAGHAVPDGTAVVIATSGSTGVPKRVVLSGDALRASAEATARRIGSGQWMLALSAGYVAGLQVLVRSHIAGTVPVLLEGRFTPAAFTHATAALRGEGERFTSLVPAQLATLVAAADSPEVRAALAAYDAILIGGQALPLPLRERAADLGARIVRTYGSSETAGGCVYDGVPLDGVRVEPVDGELRIAGATVADGYLGDPELTARTFPLDGAGTRWYRTGDLGEVDAGVVRVTGRADNVIVSGGINVSLDRVERAVRAVPRLEDAVVVPIPDERWGQGSAIVAAARPGARESELLAAARDRVAAEVGPAARPSRILLVAALPQLASGKPDRRAIAALANGAGIHLPADVQTDPLA